MDHSQDVQALKIVGLFAIAFFGLLIVVAAGGVLALILCSYYLAYESENWPSTQGVVVDTELESRNGSHSVQITFEYDVDGESYQGSNIGYSFQTAFETDAAAKHFLAPYQKETPVQVYYDPDNPGSSALKPGMRFGKGDLLLFLFMSGLLLIGIWLSIFGARKTLRNYRPALNESRIDRRNRTPAERRQVAQGFMCMAAMLTIAACLGFCGGRYAERRAQDAAAWPSTKGRITSSDVRFVKPGRRSIGHDAAFIEYEFAVNGQKYRGDSRRILPAIQGSDGSAEQTAARYRAGTVVDVFYDPNNPRDAVLDNTVDDFGMRIINQYVYLCLTSIAGAIALLVVGIRKYKRADHIVESAPPKESPEYVPQASGSEDLNVAVQDALHRYAQM